MVQSFACRLVLGIGAIVLAVLFALRQYSRISGGGLDLVIRDDARMVTLPMNFGRDYPLEVTWDDISANCPADEVPCEAGEVDAFERVKYAKRDVRPDDQLRDTGHRGEINYAVVMCIHDAEQDKERPLPIAKWTEFRRANAFAMWLQQRLGRAQS